MSQKQQLKQDNFCNNTFLEINNTKQRVYRVSYCLKQLSHPAAYTSNVQCVRLAAGRHTQAGDAIDIWRDQ